MNSRRGFTLAELLVVITATTVILSAAGVLMHFVFQLNSEVRQTTQVVADVGRMAEQFRRDVHQARGVPMVAVDRRSAELQLLGGKIVKWRIDEPRGLVRTEEASAATNRQNTYNLRKGTTATFELRSSGPTRIVSVRVHAPGNGGPSLAIEALAARDQPLAGEEQ